MEKSLEEILGLQPGGLKRTIPGTIIVDGREFWYVEHRGSEDFNSQFQSLIESIHPPLYSKGSAITGGCELLLPDGRKFNSLSFKGDLDGWRRQIVLGAQGLGIDIAQAVGGELRFGNGAEIPISACSARFY